MLAAAGCAAKWQSSSTTPPTNGASAWLFENQIKLIRAARLQRRCASRHTSCGSSTKSPWRRGGIDQVPSSCIARSNEPILRREIPMRRFIALITSMAALAVLAPGAFAVVRCTELATNPANGLVGAPGVKSVNSQIVAANATVSYCQVNILYGTNANQNINIRVGLPLNSLDGGTGGVQGAWNGRTAGIGGGGGAGSLPRSEE